MLAAVLLFAQVFAGRSVLFHEHDEAGAHFHLTHEHVTHEHVTHAHHARQLSLAWHAARHAHDVGDDSPSAASEGAGDLRQIFVHVPASDVVSTRVVVSAGTFGLHPPALAFEVATNPTGAGPSDRPPAASPERFQNRSQRSGIATLLRSSRAILI